MGYNYLVLFEKYNIPILIDMVILHWLGLAEYSKKIYINVFQRIIMVSIYIKDIT